VALASSTYKAEMAPHKRFIAWQECHKLVLAVYQATKSFPRHELNEFRHFLDIALGSLAELEYALEVAAALEYLRPEVYTPLQAQQQRARFFTWKLKKSMS
jgi:hypothetical protein